MEALGKFATTSLFSSLKAEYSVIVPKIRDLESIMRLKFEFI
jgi:hypothetical protein